MSDARQALPSVHDDPADAAVLQALYLGLQAAPAGASGATLFIGARAAPWLRYVADGWLLEQPFRPEAAALEAAGFSVATATEAPVDGEPLQRVLVLPSRQRTLARGELARAVQLAAPTGVVLAAAANRSGAPALQSDLAGLAGPVGHLSKHKCRAVWTLSLEQVDVALRDAWLAGAAVQRNAQGWVSRPGLFAWDRIDPASALLVAHLPASLQGRVADFGGGYGYLSGEVLRRFPGVEALDLFEADARALPAARRNLEDANAARAAPATLAVHWHDLAHPPAGRFDAVVCNPPFHVGRADRPALGRAFIASAAAVLADHGALWLVANRHLPYEATLATCFEDVAVLADAQGFKVLRAARPRSGGAR